jgi:hypothetical protein
MSRPAHRALRQTLSSALDVALDLSDFDPKAPPLKTEAFWAIVAGSHVPEDAELADAIDKLGGRDGRARQACQRHGRHA